MVSVLGLIFGRAKPAVAQTWQKLSTSISPTFTGTVTAPTFSGALTGNASTATSAATLTTARNISLTGPITGSTSFNGGANVSIATAFADSGWITATLVNGFSHGASALQYRSVGPVVYLQGTFSRATVPPFATVVCTLPVGFRPDKSLAVFASVYADNLEWKFGDLGITTGGVLSINLLGANFSQANPSYSIATSFIKA